jgi:secreted Zn-dependent insulinase-like peptidase
VLFETCNHIVLFRSIQQQLSGGNGLRKLAHDRQRCGSVRLPLQRPLQLAVKAVNPDEKNSAVQVYLQLGDYSYHLRALQLLCHQTLNEPLFNKLRTEQQLGYSVSISPSTLHNYLQLSMLHHVPDMSLCSCTVPGQSLIKLCLRENATKNVS